ncbi:hypothetical protein M378DRAFT_168604 [Amanita muscaria Koide BX008]|uniref:Uncharacterized protein n=1 Tax=Amanita muscaria (strain Koide BX008) TaxID=946122 RepID=A0A0C2WTA3_AMAMK|nr:hypothetical protein M378DRAFT_168604 [Amanita muscaria Koide BX008]
MASRNGNFLPSRKSHDAVISHRFRCGNTELRQECARRSHRFGHVYESFTFEQSFAWTPWTNDSDAIVLR